MPDFFPITNEDELDELMSRPRPVLIEFMRSVSSPLLILGAGGKMGPTLALLARRAADAAGNQLKIIAASRFSDPKARYRLEDQGVHTLSVDLMERNSFEELPDASNVIYLIGVKFGTTQNPGITWATNTLIPAYACERYPKAKMVALSSGNVYPLTRCKVLALEKLMHLNLSVNTQIAAWRVSASSTIIRPGMASRLRKSACIMPLICVMEYFLISPGGCLLGSQSI